MRECASSLRAERRGSRRLIFGLSALGVVCAASLFAGIAIAAFCRMVPIGGGRVISCLRDNLQRVSSACHKVLTSGL